MSKNGALWLSEIADKVRIECDCGLKRQYDAEALLARIDDLPMPSLLNKLAKANGCTKTENPFSDRCRLVYCDLSPKEAPPSRSYRLAMRSQPDDRKKSPSPTCRNGVSFSANANVAVENVTLIATAWRVGSARSSLLWPLVDA